MVRTKIKAFASVTASQVAKGYPCPPFKIIILDEADAMTADAQSALRRTIEQHSKVTRFCLICNYVSRIIEPLASRCAKFRFKPLSVESLETRIVHVRDCEGVKCDEAVVKRLVDLSGGDLRQAITFLQSAHRYKKRSTAGSPKRLCQRRLFLIPASLTLAPTVTVTTLTPITSCPLPPRPSVCCHRAPSLPPAHRWCVRHAPQVPRRQRSAHV